MHHNKKILSRFILLCSIFFILIFLQTPITGVSQTNYNYNFEKLNDKGVVLANLGIKVQDTQYYNAAVTLDPNYAFALVNNAISLYNLGRYAEAIQYYDKALQLDFSYKVLQRDLGFIGFIVKIDFSNHIDGVAFLGKGSSLANLGRYAEAIQNFDKALQLNYNALTLDLKEVIPYFDKALQRDYNDEILQILKSVTLKLKKLYYESFNINKIFYSGALSSKGLALASLGKYPEAIQYYNAALRINPHDDSVLNNKGVALASLGKYPEAIQYYNAALMINPHNIYALNNNGLAFASLGKYPEAIIYYDKVLSLSPNDVNVLNNKGNALSALGMFQEANEQYDKALELSSRQQMLQDGFRIPPVAYKLLTEAPKEFDQNLGTYSDLSYMRNQELPILKEHINIIFNSMEDLKKHNDLLLLVKTTAFVNVHTFAEFNRLQCIALSEKLGNVVLVIGTQVNKGINLFEEGTKYNKATKYKEANEWFDKALQQDANYGPALFYKHLTLQKLGNPDADKFKVKFESLNCIYNGERIDHTLLQVPQVPKLPIEVLGFDTW
jgi:tetratricopeptide (TPR) repeat protein